MGPSGKIKTPTAPKRRAASHASDKNGKGAVALDTTLGVTGCGLDRGVLERDLTTTGIKRRSGRQRPRPERGITGAVFAVVGFDS
jgi:hypothetical protein